MEQKHLEIMLLIAKLIDRMIYPIDSQKEGESRLVVIKNRQKVIKIHERSPQFIAKRYLNNIPGIIFKIF